MTLQNFRLLFALVVIVLMQSCSIMDDVLEASFDFSHHRYGEDSNKASSADKTALGFNAAAMIFVSASDVLGDGVQTKQGFINPPADNNYALGFSPGSDSHTYGSFMQPYGSPVTMHNSPSGEGQKFMDNVQVLTGLQFVMKNSKDGLYKIHQGYLEVPVYGIYNYHFTDGGTFFGGLGPYFAYGVAGKIKSDGFSMPTFDKEEGFKRFDAGACITLGYKLPMGISLRLAYDMGLVDIDRFSDDFARNRSYSINIGYSFYKILHK